MQKFKPFNLILCIELFCVIIGYVTLKLKRVKPVTTVTVVKLMTLRISSKIAPRIIRSGSTGSTGGNISLA